MLLPDALEAGEAVHLGHPHVQKHEIRIGARDQRDDLTAVAGRADDLDPLDLGEGPLQSLEDQPVVVRKQDPNRHSRSLSPSAPGERRAPLAPPGCVFHSHTIARPPRVPQ